jgi:NTE family protein
MKGDDVGAKVSQHEIVASPVHGVNDDPGELLEGVALCLSGGGYRAMLFHLGALWRLNELGWLLRLNRVSSVSGGSITNGVLALAWDRLEFDERGIARAFHDELVEPIRRFANQTIDVPSIIKGLLTSESAGDYVAEAYDAHLFHGKTLQDLPDEKEGVAPDFIFNACNMQSGALFRFSKPYIRDWRVGEILNPRVRVALAVTASSAFPPFLSPFRLSFSESDYVANSGEGLQMPPYTTAPALTDGGVYDNLGLETAWKRYRTILVSDGGGGLSPDPEPHRDWLRELLHIIDLIDTQVTSLHKRQVLASYQLPRDDSTTWRSGTYWGIRTDIANYGLSDALPCPYDKTILIANEPTRLAKFSAIDQERTVNWGYAVCDAAMRRWVIEGETPPPRFPYASATVG